jgi:hypothetical protein
MKKILKILIILLIISILFGCSKNLDSNEDDIYYIENTKDKNGDSSSEKILKLPVPYNRLETFLVKDFIPILGLKLNLDSDIDNEICIVYKKNKSSNINVAIFDLASKKNIKKKVEFETKIFDPNSFSFQSRNLFYEDDISLIVEGNSIENKNLLYIYMFSDDMYEQAQEFEGDYSVIINYEELETEKGKYERLKNVSTIDNHFTSTNTSIQQKKVYVWNYDNSEFEISEVSKILYSNTFVDRSVYDSELNFLNYLDGFWYPEKYKTLIDNNTINTDLLNNNTIEFLSFDSKQKEINIKRIDYLIKLSIAKMNRLWQQKPGLRFNVKGIYKHGTKKEKYLEIYLVDANRIKLSGLNSFREEYYVRLPRPFIEYVKEKSEDKINNEINSIVGYLKEEFRSKDDCVITFSKKNDYIIKKDNSIEKGIYKISFDKLGYIISFLSDTNNNILNNKNFIIKLSSDSQTFTLVPVNITLNKFIVDDIKATVFYKQSGRG